MSAYAEVIEWEDYEGGVNGYNADMVAAIEVESLQNQARRARWGERYTPGRIWHVVHEDGTIQHGHSANVRTAKREAQAALAVGGHDIVDSRWGQ